VLDLDVVEADAMDSSDEILDNQNQEREEDPFDYDGIALDVGGPCDPAPEEEWDPVNFYRVLSITCCQLSHEFIWNF